MTLKGVKILKKNKFNLYVTTFQTPFVSLHLHKPRVFWSNPLNSRVDLKPQSHEDGFTQRSEKMWRRFLFIDFQFEIFFSFILHEKEKKWIACNMFVFELCLKCACI